MEGRKKSVNIDKMSEEDFNNLQKNIDNKIEEVSLEALLKLNKILNPYGIKITKVNFEHEAITKEDL